MLKKHKGISINVISVLIILMSLFMLVVGETNSWFSSRNYKGVQIVAQIGILDLKLYQEIESVDYEILSNAVNAEESKEQYVQLSGEIAPDEEIDLILTLKNEDPGSTSMYVKFKFEVFARGVSADTLIPCEISGFAQPSDDSNGFVLSNGYYYLKDKSGKNVVLRSAKELSEITNTNVEVGEEIQLMNKFKIPFSSFVDASGNFIYNNSETLYIKLTVIASIAQEF